MSNIVVACSVHQRRYSFVSALAWGEYHGWVTRRLRSGDLRALHGLARGPSSHHVTRSNASLCAALLFVSPKVIPK